MVTIKDNNITMTRGDSLNLKVAIIKNKIVDSKIKGKIPDSREFLTSEELDEMGAQIYFNMSRYYPGQIDYKLIINNKRIPTQTMALRLDPSDTKEVPLGIYNYDISIHYPQEDSSEEKIDTFISGQLQLVGECNGIEGIVNDYRNGVNTI